MTTPDLYEKLLAKVDAYDKLFKDTFTGVNYGTALVLECAFNSFSALRIAVEMHQLFHSPITFDCQEHWYCKTCTHATERADDFCPELRTIAKELGVDVV